MQENVRRVVKHNIITMSIRIFAVWNNVDGGKPILYTQYYT